MSDDEALKVRCVRAVWVMADDDGHTWLAPGPVGRPDTGGIMPDLRPGTSVPMQSEAAGRISVQVAEEGPWAQSRLVAYPIDSALLSTVLSDG